MHRFVKYALTAAAVTALGLSQPASASVGGICNGEVDADCTYYDGSGRAHHCNAWVDWQCGDPSISTTIGGDCNGLVDVNCTDWSGFCTLWTSTLGCVIG